MKKSILLFIGLAFCLLCASCAVSADQMLVDFNDQVYEDLGDGTYVTNNGEPNVSTTLIPKPVYRVAANSVVKIEVAKDFLEYKWTLIDNSSNKEYDLGLCYFTYVEAPILKLSKGGNYTIKLLVTSRNGLLFTDSATLKVVENIL